MAVGSYSYSELLNEIVDSARRANITNVITARIPINRGARRVLQDVDLRGTKRNSVLGTDLFNDIYTYPSPSDLKGDAVIDIIPQVNRSSRFRVTLVDEAEFDLKKYIDTDIIAIARDELVNTIKFSGDVDDETLTMATFDTTTADGGTWTAFGDATNVTNEADNFIAGAGSVEFDLTGSGTTAGLENTSVTSQDISAYVNAGHVFVWVYINSTTNLTNWILRIGSSSSDYYTQTVTTDNASAAFVNGWNLLRFDFASMTETGSVTDTAVNYVALYMTKTSGKNDDGYRIDHMVLHSGEIHNILYYSRFPWQSSAGSYLEDSTADTDLLNAETDEFDGFVFRCKAELFREVRRFDLVKDAMAEYKEWKSEYQRKNPSERVHRNRFYYDPNLYHRKF